MKESKEAEKEIAESSNFYSPAAVRGSLIFFLFTELYKLHTFYKFSLESFIFVVRRAIKDVAARWKAKLHPEDKKKKEGDEKEEDQEEPKKEEPKEQKEEKPAEQVVEGEPAKKEGEEEKKEGEEGEEKKEGEEEKK